jgi:Anti-sigma-28 factor, FlgM
MSVASSKGDEPDRRAALREERVTQLKEQIALREYHINSEAVAREILFKMRIVSRSRRALLADPSRQRPHTPGERS